MEILNEWWNLLDTEEMKSVPLHKFCQLLRSKRII